MRDFTIDKYRCLLEQLLASGYRITTVSDFVLHGADKKTAVLRHDVDLLPMNSLTTARLEHTLGISATYYFRIVDQSNNPQVIRQIAALGHEIGYHYEDLTTAQGDIPRAYESFCGNLEYFRQFYPVNTICMHGSPRSRFDSRDLWRKYDYHELGIVAEPYLDLDFSRLFYLTDTGRCWDGYKVSVRDKIPKYQDLWTAAGLTYHSTDDIIEAIGSGTLPSLLMLTTHPQRWTNDSRLWWKEAVSQKIKNLVKRILVLCR